MLRRDALQNLVTEFEQATGEPTGNAVELIQTISKYYGTLLNQKIIDAEGDQYSLEQVLEVLVPQLETPLGQPDAGEGLEKVDEQSPPLKLQMEKDAFEQLQASKATDIERKSQQVLESKFKLYAVQIEYF